MKTVRTSIEKTTEKLTIDMYNNSSIKIDRTKIGDTTEEEFIKIEKNENQNIVFEYEQLQDNEIIHDIQINYQQTLEDNKLDRTMQFTIANEKYKATLRIKDNTKIVQEFENQITLENNNVKLDELQQEQKDRINQILNENIQQQLSNLFSKVSLQDYTTMLQNLSVIEKKSVQLLTNGQVTDIERKRFNSQFEFFVSQDLTTDNIKELIKTAESNFDDMKILTKTYSENTADAGENVKLTDEDGNDLIVNVKITNIDKKSPTIEVKYELATDKKSSKVTIKANEKIQEISGWTLSSDQMSLTKTYTKNTDSSGETIQIKDLAGNVQNAVVKIANIEEETKKDLKVNVEYKTKDGKVEAKIIANNKLQKVSGWTLSEDGLSLSKTYSANTEETVEVRDIYNNVAKVSIKVTTIKSNSTNNTNNNTTTTTNNNTTSAKSDNSTASKILPKTGIMRAIIAIVGIILVGIAIFLYKKNKYWKDI